MLLKSPWTARVADGEGPVYRRIAAAVAQDFGDGLIPPGARLPAHRELAFQLKVSVGVVTKAYALLIRQGVTESVKGSAMYISSRRIGSGPIALNVNVPPNLMSAAMLSRTLSSLAQVVDERDLASAAPHEGSESHRRCLATWLRSYCRSIEPESMILCNGGQHAIWLAVSVLAREKIVVLTDELPFSGLRSITSKLGIELRGVRSDEGGIQPAALTQAIEAARSGGFEPVLYCSPTAQNPTGVSMPKERLQDISRICRANEIYVIEDDVYAAFAIRDHVCLHEKIPERTFYVNSFAKILSPWFRLGVLVTPNHLLSDTLEIMNAQGSKVSPIIAHVIQEWITCGLATEVAHLTHQEGINRNSIARDQFSNQEDVLIGNGFHMFLPLPFERSKTLCDEAMKYGIVLGDPAVNLLQNSGRSGVRVCLGGPQKSELKEALAIVATLYARIK
jgi:DNA-binding transcriptional MocR family regulator